MGLFSGKTQITVSSTVHNLAGDPKDRPDIMKAVILRSVLGDRRREGMGKQITDSLISGTGMSLRKYYHWAQDNYYLDFAGTVGDKQPLNQNVIYTQLRNELALASNQTLEILTAEIGGPDPGFFADDYILRMRPDLDVDENGDPTWSCDYDRLTEEIIIQIPNEPDTRIPAPADLVWIAGSKVRKLLYVTYRLRTQYLTGRFNWGPVYIFTYRMNSGGNTQLDTLDDQPVSMAGFYPAIPIRTWNMFTEDYYPASKTADIEAAFNKLTGSTTAELIEQLKQNAFLYNIDHVYVVPGVDLGAKDKASMQYLYKFFSTLKEATNLQDSDTRAAIAAGYAYENGNWKLSSSQLHGAQPTSSQNWGTVYQPYTHPLYGQDPAPQRNVPTAPPYSELSIFHGDWTNFYFTISWNYIKETDHVGNMKRFDGVQRALAKTGEYWVTMGPPVNYPYSTVLPGGIFARINSGERLYIFHQYAPRRYSRLEIVGLQHLNYAYPFRAVVTRASQAVYSSPNQPSGFLIPLHYPTFKSMGLVKGAQLSGSVSHLVLNSYEINKIPWYATGFFKFILVIASVALSVFTAGGSLAAGAGLLGTNLAVGTALGVSATAAALVGAIVNYVAAVIVTQLISWGAKELFGEEWGSIIGAIASFVAINVGTNLMSGGDFNFQFNELLRPENLLSITNSASRAYSAFINSETEEIYEEMDALESIYDEKFKEIEELSDEILGMTNGLINPMMFTDAANEYLGESSKAFLSRTLLVGSDIADLSHIMIENFADISLELPRGVSY